VDASPKSITTFSARNARASIHAHSDYLSAEHFSLLVSSLHPDASFSKKTRFEVDVGIIWYLGVSAYGIAFQGS
jgi:hypothetical protein